MPSRAIKHLPMGIALSLGMAAIAGGLWLHKTELVVLAGINFLVAVVLAISAVRR